MHKLGLAFLLLASSCATTYKESRNWEYVGNGNYLVSIQSRGVNTVTAEKRLYYAASEACFTEHKKGFRMANARETHAKTETTDYGIGQITVSASENGFTALVTCEGEPDPIMLKKLHAVFQEPERRQGESDSDFRTRKHREKLAAESLSK